MRKGLTEIIFILDRSGSMSGLESDTIGGFNSLIEKQKEEGSEACITTVLFDDKIELLHDRNNLAELGPMTEKDYFVRGSTALLDAVGETVHRLETIYQYARDEDIPEKTMVVITTDGMENASRRYSYSEVSQMVKLSQEKRGWEYIFLGANLDAAETACRIGIRRDHAANYTYDGKGIQCCYDSVSMAVKSMCSNKECPIEIPEFLKKVRGDYEDRSGAMKK